MSTIWDYEGVISKVSRRASGRGWTRRATFFPIPESLVDSLLPAEWTEFPGESGKHAAVLTDSAVSDVVPRTTGAGGMVSRVTLFYRQRTAEEWLVANPNSFLLIRSNTGYHSGSQSERLTIEQETPDLTRVDSASDLHHFFKGRPIFRVYGYTNDLATYVNPFLGNAYATNLTEMVNFGKDENSEYWGKIGRLMLLNLICRPSLSGQSIHQVNYILTTPFLPRGNVSGSTTRIAPIRTTYETDDVPPVTKIKVRFLPTSHGVSYSTSGALQIPYSCNMSAIDEAIIDW